MCIVRYGIVYVGFPPQALAMSIGSNTVAIVTGGSRGIGFATASALLARGAAVGDYRHRRAAARGRARAPCRRTAGSRVLALRADVRVEADVAQAVTRVVDRMGRARHPREQRRRRTVRRGLDDDGADWHRVVDTNLTGVYHCCHAAIPHLKARGGGWIINVSSLAGKNPFVGGAAVLRLEGRPQRVQ